MKRKETYLSRDFRETVALRFPAQAKELNTAFDMRLSALLAENAGASKEKQYHLKRQILPGIAAYETLQRVMPKEEAIPGRKRIQEEQGMLLQVILEGLGLGVLLVLICAAGIRKGAVGMVHLYSPAVQQRCVKLGLTSPERIRRNSLLFKAVCVPGYISYVLVCVYGINGARSFAAGFWQLLVILSVMNLIDRFLIDGYWVGHTNAWTIPGTED